MDKKQELTLLRREFLSVSAGLFSSSLWPGFLAKSAHAAAPVEAIADGVIVHNAPHQLMTKNNAGLTSNSTLIVGKKFAAVVDTGGSFGAGKKIRDEFRRFTDKPIKFVINTHMHPDHVLGNAAFKTDDSIFVAHHKMARGLKSRAERYLETTKLSVSSRDFDKTEIIYPNLEVKTQTRFDLGGRELVLTSHPTAHTDNDMSIFDTGTDTLLLGDLLFSEHIPSIDGSILGWLKLLGEFSNLPAKRVVPGHGPNQLPWPSALEPLKLYLNSIANDVRQMISDDKSLAYAIEHAGQKEKDNWQLQEHFHARNVTATYAELEWED